MVAQSRTIEERVVCGILRVLWIVGVGQAKLDGAAVHAGALAVGAGVAIDPSDATEHLAIDCRGALRLAVALVQKDRFTALAIVCELQTGRIVSAGRVSRP